MIATAQGDASRFRQVLTEYSKAPQVTRDRLYLDAMQHILSSTTKVVAEKGSNNLLYLPLDKIMQMGGTGTGVAAESAAPPPAAK